MEKDTFDRHIRLIVGRLKKCQRKDGSWSDNNFIHALTAYSLSEMKAPQTILEKSANFIISQKNTGWTWNYDSTQKYPDDLDDTFCSLIALHKIRPHIIDAAALAHISELLLNAEREENGPYETWVGTIWPDIDPVVNANISYFASLYGIELPKVTHFIDTCITPRRIASKYYQNQFLALYCIARNYRGLRKKYVIAKIENLTRKTQFPGKINLTNAALAACALAHLDAPAKKIRPLITKIATQLETRTQFSGEALYTEKIKNGVAHYAYSEAFTLAVCGEAIAMYRKARQKAADMRKQDTIRAREEKILRAIQSLAEKRCLMMLRPLSNESIRMLRETIKKDCSGTITLLPHRIAFSLGFESITKKTSVVCGLLSLYGWIAYSIYDQIIDGEECLQVLPIANVFHGEMTALLSRITRNVQASLCRKMIDSLNCAQLCEVKNRINLKNKTRRPDMPSEKQTIDKSIGFALPSILALSLSGLSATGTDMRKFISLFRHFIFIKQMSDDIRDWREDIKNQIATIVTARLWDNADNAECVERILVASARDIIEYCRTAKKILGSSRRLSKSVFLFNMIDAHEHTAQAFLEKHTKEDPEPNSSGP